MGSIAVTTFIKNIRSKFLNEQIDDADLANPGAGTNWKNSEIVEYFNMAKDDLWDLVKNARLDYFEVTNATPLALVPGTKEYALASGFRQLVGIRVSTTGYEHVSFRRLGQATEEFRLRNSLAAGNSQGIAELVYDIIGTATLKLADYPPASMTVPYDYIGFIADVAIADLSISQINDEWRRYLEVRTAWWALQKNTADPRFAILDRSSKEYERKITESIAPRDISQPVYVEAFNP